MNENETLLTGYPIYIATKEVQRRKHKRKRINKKWRKRYGVIEYNSMPHGEIFFNEIDRVFYMTKKTYIEFTKLGRKRGMREWKYMIDFDLSQMVDICKICRHNCTIRTIRPIGRPADCLFIQKMREEKDYESND